MTSQNKLNSLLTEVVFLPSPQMRQTKAVYWTSIAESNLYDKSTTTLAAALDVTNDSRLSKWWSVEGFSRWFCNKEEFRHRVEYLANLALDTIEEILLDSDENANARMKAAQLMLTAAAKMPGNSDTSQLKMIDDRIQRMGKAELESFLKQNMNIINSLDSESKNT
jgi:hypothetical protein